MVTLMEQCISKWGHVSDGSLVAYDPKEAPLFRPDGLEPDVHVKWWMPMLENGWHTLKEQKPREGQEVLTKDSYAILEKRDGTVALAEAQRVQFLDMAKEFAKYEEEETKDV